MKILGLFFNPEVRTGGHRRYLELIQGLGQAHEVILFSSKKTSLNYDKARTIVAENEHDSSNKRSINYRNYAEQIYENYEQDLQGVDWIVIFGETHFYAALFLKRKLGAKILFAYRSDAVVEDFVIWKSRKKSFSSLRSLIKSTLKYYIYGTLIGWSTSCIVFQSEYDRKNWCKRHPGNSKKTRIIGGNIGLPWYKKEYESKNTSTCCRNLLYIGSINERKGIRYFIESFDLISEECPGLQLKIAGFGPDEEVIKDLIIRLGLTERIHWLGRVQNPFPLYLESDLLVVPSFFDSYPNTVLEAIHTGCPVIGSATGGITDILKDDLLLFKPGDRRELSHKIKTLYSDDHEYMKYKAVIEEKLDSFHFNWSARFEEILERTDS